MVQARELRIGNLVSTYGTNGNPNGWTDMQVIPYHILTCDSRPEWFSPIPLTEEWLLRMGFSKTYAEKCYERRIGETEHYLYITFANSENIFALGDRYYTEENITEFTKPLCAYVHQLQNIYYALNGEELTIKDN